MNSRPNIYVDKTYLGNYKSRMQSSSSFWERAPRVGRVDPVRCPNDQHVICNLVNIHKDFLLSDCFALCS
jgi:hypothetical protein